MQFHLPAAPPGEPDTNQTSAALLAAKHLPEVGGDTEKWREGGGGGGELDLSWAARSALSVSV